MSKRERIFLGSGAVALGLITVGAVGLPGDDDALPPMAQTEPADPIDAMAPDLADTRVADAGSAIANPYAPLVQARTADQLAALSLPSNTQEAAWYAWTQFISVNMPADCTGPNDKSCIRDKAGAGTLGSNYEKAPDQNDSKPAVWMSTRHKTEVYTNPLPPSGYNTDLPWNAKNQEGKGYSLMPPEYLYVENGAAQDIEPCTSSIVAANVTLTRDQPAVRYPALVNLDETNQIGENEIFAGTVDPDFELGVPSEALEEQNLIRFMAKTNFETWAYVTTTPSGASGDTLITDATQKLKKDSSLNTQTIQNIASTGVTNGVAPPPADGQISTVKVGTTYDNKGTGVDPSGTAKAPLIQYPSASMEFKTGWRRLNADERRGNTFVTQNVRYYHPTTIPVPGSNPVEYEKCYVESDDQGEVWGMVALHIILKSDDAPGYFTFATFGHVTNILTEDGSLIEQPDGKLTEQAIDTQPTTPTLTSSPDFTRGKGGTTEYVQQSITANGEQCGTSDFPIGESLYYINAEAKKTPEGIICFNRRWHTTPDDIIAVNNAAQTELQGNGWPNGLFANYRLTGVQWKPFSWAQIDDGDHQLATYYLANEVVETNLNLQSFRGEFDQGLVSDYANGRANKATKSVGPTNKGLYNNTFDYDADSQTWTAYNMGGCMGCHGVAQVVNGSDFSFLLAFQPTKEPEAFQPTEYPPDAQDMDAR